MIRRIFNTIPALLCALFLFASCDKEQFDTGHEQGGDSQRIRFEISVGTATAIPSGQSAAGTPQTRVATEFTNYTSSFSNGDEVGVFIVKGDGGLKASGNWVDNLKMTFNGTDWDYNDIYYPAGGEKVNFYAYYPYQADANPLNLTLRVNADQRDKSKFNENHLLTAVKSNVSPSTSPVQLTFSHLLALVELKVTSGGIGARMSDMVATTLEGFRTQLTVNLGTATATPSGNAVSLQMCRKEQPIDADYLTSYIFRALVPPQTAQANATLFHFAQGTHSMSHKPVSPVVMQAGTTQPYAITLKTPDLDVNHAYAAGDAYPHKGFPIGVVYEVSNGGKNGKVIGLEEKEGLSWGPINVTTNANNQNNGLANMRTIKALAGWKSLYPVFSWVDTKNPVGTSYADGSKNIWYLPARNELRAFGEIWRTNPSLIDNALNNAGGIGVTDKFYVTSTEGSELVVYYVRIRLGSVNSGNMGKNDRDPARIILAF